MLRPGEYSNQRPPRLTLQTRIFTPNSRYGAAISVKSLDNPMALAHGHVMSNSGMLADAGQPIRFAGSVLDAQRHVCAFFHNPDEEYRVLLPFIKDGFDQGEKAFHIVDPKLRAEHRLRLASVRIDVDAVEASGQFELCN